MRIKAKSGYNVILDDIKIALHHGKDFIEVDDKVFASSNDAKRFKDLIEIDTVNQKKTSSDSKTNKSKKEPFNVVQTAANVFVINSDDNNKKSDIIVADPNHELKKQSVATKKTDSIKNEAIKINDITKGNEATKGNETIKGEQIEIKPIESEPAKTEIINKEVVKANETPKTESVKSNELVKNESVKSEPAKDAKVNAKADESKKIDNKSKAKVDTKASASKDKK